MHNPSSSLNLLNPRPLSINVKHLPINLDAILPEYPFNLSSDILKVFRSEREDRGSRSGEADSKKARVGGICQL